MLNLALALFFLLTSSATNGNKQITSKSFTGVEHLGTGETICMSVTTEFECTADDVNALGEDDEDDYTYGECGDEFKKSCNVELVSQKNGRAKVFPLVDDESEVCGEAVFTILAKDCSQCDHIENLMGLMTEHTVDSTCEDHEPGFIQDFINKVKAGELLYVGILLALIVVPIIICFMICCCCMAAAQPQGVTTYKIRSAV